MPALGILTFVTLFTAYPLVDAPAERVSEWGGEVFAPRHANRPLHLANLHGFVAHKEWHALGVPLSMKLGGTLSRATGQIIQLEGDINDGSLREQHHDSPAWGVGPSIEAKAALWTTPTVRWAMDLMASGMWYDRPFPAGGLRYNGMFQIGPSLEFTLSHQQSLSLGAHWMHLSNGHGLTPKNPSYEGHGLVLRYRLVM